MDERDGPCGFSAVDGPHGPHGERGQFALPHGFLSNSQQNSLSYAVGASSLVLAGLASDYAAATLPSCARSFQVLVPHLNRSRALGVSVGGAYSKFPDVDWEPIWNVHDSVPENVRCHRALESHVGPS